MQILLYAAVGGMMILNRGFLIKNRKETDMKLTEETGR